VPAFALLGVLLYTDFQPFDAGLEANDPANFVSGEVDDEAVNTITSFSDYPVLWLGNEYQGFKLTAVQRNVTPDDSLLMTYGSCLSQDRCIPPILIIVTAPSPFPRLTGEPTPTADDPSAFRGLFRRFGEHGLATSAGLVFRVQAEAVAEQEVLEDLELANPAGFGLPPIGPGQSLTPLHSWSP
jgi:hypothetical protein